MTPTRVAIVGLGKIARTEHVPAIAADERFELIATADPFSDGVVDVPHFDAFEALPNVEAIAICTPPQARFAIASAAIAAGKHVLLEKPPCVTPAEVEALKQRAAERDVTLFAAWHSRFAVGVAPAKAWLARREIRRIDVVWREDVRVWHPGQKWIWEAGGFGVFDPGINALSIVTALVHSALRVREAELFVPANRAAPIAARAELEGADGPQVSVDLDWRQPGNPTWDIVVETDAGRLVLSKGGACVEAAGVTLVPGPGEYPALYAHFASLIAANRSDADSRPLAFAAECLRQGTVVAVDTFEG